MLERGDQRFTKHPLLAETVILAEKDVFAESLKYRRKPKPKHILAETEPKQYSVDH